VVAIEKTYEIDDYVSKLIDLDVIQKNLKASGKGSLEWRTKFDGVLYTLTIYHINEL
tara:strand:+ start:694 stop:864 length:171 start_codon:yes stop_codon:yes gene_type:complete